MKRKWVSLKDYPVKRVEGTTLVCEGHRIYPDARITAEIEGEFLRLITKISPGDSSLYFEGHHLSLALQGQGPSSQSYYAHNSFAFNGVRPELQRRVRLQGGAPRISRLNNLMFRERRGVAWWVTALKESGSSRAIVMGAESARTLSTRFTAQRIKGALKVDIYQGVNGEYVRLNREIKSDPVLVSFSEAVFKTLEMYADLVAKRTPPLPFKAPSRGWSSWYKYYPRIDEEIIGRETELVKEKLGEYGFTLLQMDDGYQPKVGDWTNRPDRFPSGLGPSVSRIRSRELRPGIWIAPFMVDRTSRLARELAKPEWFLHSYRGKKLTYRIPRHSVNYILDITHPEVERWLRSRIQELGEWGYEYLKLDFLFLQAAQARRHDPSVTGLEAYARALRAIVEEAGPNTEILHSGSIDLAGIGLGHANRTGPDIAYDVLGGNTRLAYIKAQLAATASHAFMAHRWFTPNADAIMIRPPLKPSLVEVMLAQVAMTSGDFILSDDLNSLSADRLSKLVDPRILSIAGARGRVTPLDLFKQISPLKIPPNPLMVSMLYRPPTIWFWRAGARKALFVYNFDGHAALLKVDLNSLARETLGETPFGDGTFKDLFHGETLNIVNGGIEVRIPPESVRIYEL